MQTIQKRVEHLLQTYKATSTVMLPSLYTSQNIPVPAPNCITVPTPKRAPVRVIHPLLNTLVNYLSSH